MTNIETDPREQWSREILKMTQESLPYEVLTTREIVTTTIKGSNNDGHDWY